MDEKEQFELYNIIKTGDIDLLEDFLNLIAELNTGNLLPVNFGSDVNNIISQFYSGILKQVVDDNLLYRLYADDKYDMIFYLIERGFTNTNVSQFLLPASYDGNLEMVRYLVEHGADVDYFDNYFTSLMLACSKGNLEMVRYLVEHGADVNIQIQSNEGNTALMIASAYGHFDIVRYLIRHGANVNLRNNVGETALLFANEQFHLGIVDYLLEHGAIPNNG